MLFRSVSQSRYINPHQTPHNPHQTPHNPHQTPHNTNNTTIPNFGQYKPEREGFTFNKEENYYQCTKPEGKQAKLLFKGEKRDSKGYTKQTYRSSESDCKNCPLREQCCGKSTKFKKLDDSIHKEHYDRMHQKLTQNANYTKKKTTYRDWETDRKSVV